MTPFRLATAFAVLVTSPTIPAWDVAPDGRSATLSRTDTAVSPLSLACTKEGRVAITVRPAGDTDGRVRLRRPAMTLTLVGERDATGRTVSVVPFDSITAEFLRDGGPLSVPGPEGYEMDTGDTRRVLDVLRAACEGSS